MLLRTLEPEVMDSPDEARDYDAMDHGEVNRLFVDHLLEQAVHSGPRSSDEQLVLDIGTGTAQIPIELASRDDSLHITAVDAAQHMLQLARENIQRARLADRIRAEFQDAKQLTYAAQSFDWVISNSIVHHIPVPLLVFREFARVVRPGGLIFIRDLLRPADGATVEQLVDQYATDANGHQRQMFHDSLHAALTLAEVHELLELAGLAALNLAQTSDRHWTVAGRPQ